MDWFDGVDLSGPVAGSQCLATIDMDFGPFGVGAAPSVGADTFSGRFTKTVTLDAGTYEFSTNSDDGVRVKVDGELVIDKWVNQAPTSWTGTKALTAGSHTIEVEYFENAGAAIAVNCVTPAAARTRIFDQMAQSHIDFMLSKIPRALPGSGRGGQHDRMALHARKLVHHRRRVRPVWRPRNLLRTRPSA